jgi:hypothetical protein
MEKEIKNEYEAPRMETIELELEGVILDGGSAGTTTEDFNYREL